MITWSLDTNAVLRFLLSDIQAQANAVENILRDAKRGAVRVTIEEAVFIEATYVLLTLYKFQKSVIVEKLSGIVNISFIDIPSRFVIQRTLNVFDKTPISFVDALLISHAKERVATLFTFDKKLARVAKRLGLTQPSAS